MSTIKDKFAPGVITGDQVQELIRATAAADSRELSDVAFSPDMLASGTYAGVFDTPGHLIAVAGTHLIARHHADVDRVRLMSYVVDVASHGDDGRHGRQVVEHCRVADVAGVKNGIRMLFRD